MSNETADALLFRLEAIERKLDECLRYARMTDAERSFDAQFQQWRLLDRANRGDHPHAK